MNWKTNSTCKGLNYHSQHTLYDIMLRPKWS